MCVVSRFCCVSTCVSAFLFASALSHIVFSLLSLSLSLSSRLPALLLVFPEGRATTSAPISFVAPPRAAAAPPRAEVTTHCFYLLRCGDASAHVALLKRRPHCVQQQQKQQQQQARKVLLKGGRGCV